MNDCTLKLVSVETSIDYAVICASGKGTRLLPITKSIPKLLVNVDNSNVLTKIVNYWKKYSSKFVVIIDSAYNDMVDFYLKMLNICYEIVNVNCTNGEENSYTLSNALKDEKFNNRKILITWCDIFPDSTIPEDIFGNENVIFTYKNFGRYEALNNSIVKKVDGNVIGIYYFSNFEQLKYFEPKMDICDCYEMNFKKFNTYEIDELTDIGDYIKLQEHIRKNANEYKTRYFNKIFDLSDNQIAKQSTCDYGNKIITYEMAFYKHHNLDNVPKIIEFGENYYIMKKILNSKNAIDFFHSLQADEQSNFITKLLHQLSKIHNADFIYISKDELINDIQIEFNEKVCNRVNNVLPLLKCFNNVKSVNDRVIVHSHEFIINHLYKKIRNHFINEAFEDHLSEKENSEKRKYQTIHGDCHLSNILVDANHDAWFIDPRGYFGETKLYGLVEYDISKIVYSLSGFDEINRNDNYFFTIDERDNMCVNISNNVDSHLHLFEEHSKDILICMTILHWFGLTDYSKNNIHKCVSSYYYAIYLYHFYFMNQ